jgi:hypothetical protein
MIELIKELKDKGKPPKQIAKEVIIQDKIRTHNLRETPMPYYRPKVVVKDDSANALTKLITEFIDACGGYGSRVNNMGINRGGQWTKSNMKAGYPDYQGVYLGKCIYVEVKYGKDKLSEAQINFLDKAEKAGAWCYVARTFDDFFEVFCDKVLLV